MNEEKRQAYIKVAEAKHAFLIFLLLSMLFFFGLRLLTGEVKEKSLAENRSLAPFPALSLKGLLDGSLAEGIEQFAADQFPFRETFLSVDQNKDFLLQGQAFKQDAGITLISRDNSNRDVVVETRPVPSQSELVLETKPSFHMEEAPVLEAGLAPEQKVSNIIIAGGRGMEIFYYSKTGVEGYAKRLAALYDELPESRRLISMVVPTAIAFYGPEALRTGASSQYDAIRDIYMGEPEGVIKVDAFAELAKHREEYLYFRSDHHWNGRGAYYGYKAFCDSLELEAEPIEGMPVTSPATTFLGTLYGYTDQSPLLAHADDQGEFFQTREQGSMKTYDGADFSNEKAGIFMNTTFPQPNHYLLYSGGDVPLAVIESSLKNDKRICVVKDSYGNGFVPFLVNHYEKVYVVDPRYFKDDLILFLAQENIQDLLVLNYVFAVGNPAWLAGFDAITGYSPSP